MVISFSAPNGAPGGDLQVDELSRACKLIEEEARAWAAEFDLIDENDCMPDLVSVQVSDSCRRV